jgi:hypothetical protein
MPLQGTAYSGFEGKFHGVPAHVNRAVMAPRGVQRPSVPEASGGQTFDFSGGEHLERLRFNA